MNAHPHVDIDSSDFTDQAEIEKGVNTNMTLLCTPSPWLTRIRFTRISLTRILKKFPFLT